MTVHGIVARKTRELSFFLRGRHAVILRVSAAATPTATGREYVLEF